MEAEIDCEIAPLILELWKAGIQTANSCEDNVPRGFVWIQFLTVPDAERFLDVVGHYDDDGQESVPSRYRRILGEGEWPDDWIYSTGLEDWSVECEVDGDDTIRETRTQAFPAFRFWMSVRFPRADLPWVVDKLKTYNGVAQAA
jgi:hypothetical protein